MRARGGSGGGGGDERVSVLLSQPLRGRAGVQMADFMRLQVGCIMDGGCNAGACGHAWDHTALPAARRVHTAARRQTPDATVAWMMSRAPRTRVGLSNGCARRGRCSLLLAAPPAKINIYYTSRCQATPATISSHGSDLPPSLPSSSLSHIPSSVCPMQHAPFHLRDSIRSMPCFVVAAV